jgi:hypothetical protein
MSDEKKTMKEVAAKEEAAILKERQEKLEKERKTYAVLKKIDQVDVIADLRTMIVPVDDWKMNVTLRSLSSLQKERWEEYTRKRTKGVTDLKKAETLDLIGVKVYLLALCIVDGDGVQIFDEKSEEDLELLNSKSAPAITVLFDKACELNRIGTDQVKAVEKNSESDL